MAEHFTVQLSGGSPWGFALQGGLDHRSPLRVGRVTAGGRAAQCGLMVGDYLLAINGEDTKQLKHLQAQQLIKKSTSSLELYCTKVRPGITSPAIGSSSFSFPVAIGSKTSPFKAPSLSKPFPPTSISNGHTRGGSLDTPSESTTTISTPSPTGSPSHADVYDIKFVGMQCQGCAGETTHPDDITYPEEITYPDATSSPDVMSPPVEITHPDETTHPEDVTYPEATSSPDVMSPPVETTPPDETTHPEDVTYPEATSSSDVMSPPVEIIPPDETTHSEEITYPEATSSPDVMSPPVEIIPPDETTPPEEITYPEATSSPDVMSPPVEIIPPDETTHPEEITYPEATPSPVEIIPPDETTHPEEITYPEATSSTDVMSPPVETTHPDETTHPSMPTGESTAPSLDTNPQQGDIADPAPSNIADSALGNVEVGGAEGSGITEDSQQQEQDVKATATEEDSEALNAAAIEPATVSPSNPSLPQETTTTAAAAEQAKKPRRHSQRNSFTMREFADVISQAAEARVRRDSSAEPPSTAPEPVVVETAPIAPQPVQTTPIAPQPVPTTPTELKPVIKPSLTQKDDVAPLMHRQPGWYQQMFQTFTSEGDEAAPQGDVEYDERGLKVRRSGSVSRIEEEDIGRKKMESPVDPVYIYDDRGLRVPVRAGGHMRCGSTPAVMQGGTEQQKYGAKFVSVSSGGSSKDDVVSSSKKSPAYKTSQYSTGPSRNYWKQKDEQHIQFDAKRRLSQEQITHSRNSSLDLSADKMTSIHPLLQAEADNASSAKSAEASQEPQQSVFERIDASKLQGALKNASVLTSLEHEGVPSHLLPALAQQSASAASVEAAAQEAKKTLQPPPTPKAQANFNFQGKNDKELSFKKGDFLVLTHLVDGNWLEGSIGGKTGIFPANYVKLLTKPEYESLVSPKPPSPLLQAKALFDFQGETERELEFQKGDLIVIDKKVDNNWFSGHLGDKKGIFPVAYVEVMEEQ